MKRSNSSSKLLKITIVVTIILIFVITADKKRISN